MSLFGVAFASSSNGIAAQRWHYLTTRMEGRPEIKRAAQEALYDVAFPHIRSVGGRGDRTILKSVDGGGSWKLRKAARPPISSHTSPSSMKSMAGSWAEGTFPVDYRWWPLLAGFGDRQSVSLYGVPIIDAKTGWAVGSLGTIVAILKTVAGHGPLKRADPEHLVRYFFTDPRTDGWW